MERLKKAVLRLAPDDASAMLDREKRTLELTVECKPLSGEQVQKLRELVKALAEEKDLSSSYRIINPQAAASDVNSKHVIKFSKLSDASITEADETFRGQGFRKASVGKKPAKGFFEKIIGKLNKEKEEKS